MSRYRIRHFSYYTKYVVVHPDSSIIYEVTIPNIVSDEGYLNKIAQAKGFSILFQQREEGEPPVVRILRKVAPFISVDDAEGILKDLDRATNTAQIELKSYHVAIILPSDKEKEIYGNRDGRTRVSVTGSFYRTEDQEFNLLDLIPLFRELNDRVSYLSATLKLYRDITDPDNIWKIKFSSRPCDKDILEPYVTQFVENARQRLGVENFQYRISLT